jgi:hypothetical protein
MSTIEGPVKEVICIECGMVLCKRSVDRMDEAIRLFKKHWRKSKVCRLAADQEIPI